jgi:hypothetical protein
MPFTDIVNTTGAKIIAYPVPVALLGAAGGERPTVEDASNSIIPTRIVRSAGGARLDYVDLEIPISSNLVNREQPADFARMIDVRLSLTGDTWPEPSGPCQHFGDYLVEHERVVNEGESLTAQSQLRPYHFGITLRGMLVWNQLTEANDWIDGEIFFNPAVDGKVLGNRSDKQRSEDLTSFLWAHPETSLTSLGQTWQTQTLSEWSLLTAIQSLCHACNENETIILNPGTSDLAVLSGGPEVKDIRLEPGQYLPHYLDKILLPLGFNWRIKYLPDEEEGEEGKTKPQITFFKRFEGTKKQVYMQMPGAVLDLEESNVNQYSISRSIADSINEAEVFGDYIRREITLPLYPMWAAADDSTSSSALDKTASGSGYYSSKQLVWRAWGANEAGDLTGLRSDAHAAGDPPDLTSVFPGAYIPHRRTIDEPISMYGQTVRIPFYLEYSTDGGTTWALCKDEFGAKLMPDMIGVLFDADVPPEELKAAGDNARLRITGTVAGDSRLRGFAAKQEYSVNGRNVRMTLNLPEKFQDRRVQTTGDFASTIPSSSTDTRNDTDAIEDYAEEIRDRNNGAEVDAEISMPGFHVGEDGYEIGDLITAIEGRDVSLNAASAEDPNPRYPQITEIRLEVTDKGPRTVLVLDRGN